ncbi:MAG: metal ABC transporter permease [Candidatus Electryonea clarkiae]|nr:metal ABC transporter permease [Candidatus Electryonea clarkiae]MDP8289010.1 metal ABC transporter permease [Candidatus Electryonea clarkiae]
MIILLDISIFSWLEPPFMMRALFALLLLAPTCGILGVHVISRKMSFFTNTISHSTFTGIALGLLLGISTEWSTVIFGVLIAILIINLVGKSNLSVDTITGVLFSAVVSLGIVIVSAMGSVTEGFESALYGDILSVDKIDIIVIGTLLVATLVFELMGFNKLIIIAINEQMARAHGINIKLWETLLGIWVAVVILIGLRFVGLILITAMLIVPAAAGKNFSKSVGGAVGWSVIVAIVSSITGLAGSYFLNSATGPTVILAATLFFMVSLIFSKKYSKL